MERERGQREREREKVGEGEQEFKEKAQHTHLINNVHKAGQHSPRNSDPITRHGRWRCFSSSLTRHHISELAHRAKRRDGQISGKRRDEGGRRKRDREWRKSSKPVPVVNVKDSRFKR